MTPITVAGTPLTLIDAADDRRVAAVAVLPDAVAEQNHGRGTGLVVLRQKIAAEERLLADQREAVGRDVRDR